MYKQLYKNSNHGKTEKPKRKTLNEIRADEIYDDFELEDMQVQDTQVTSTTQDVSMGAKSVGQNGAPGTRGAYVGPLHTREQYEENRGECIRLRTTTRENRTICWRKDVNAHKDGRTLFDPQTEKNDPCWDSDEYVLTEPWNMYGSNFVDYRMLSLCGVALGDNKKNGYGKWRLENIRVKMQFKHYLGNQHRFYSNIVLNVKEDGATPNSVAQTEWPIYNNPEFNGASIPIMTMPTNQLEWHTGMWVFRDRYNDYADTENEGAEFGNINPNPYGAPGEGRIANFYSYRAKKAVLNEVASLKYMDDNYYEFERRVNAKGGYYISSEQIIANYKKYTLYDGTKSFPKWNEDRNIMLLINELEGFTPGDNTMTFTQNEGMNVLLVPGQMPFDLVAEVEGGDETYVSWPNLRTIVTVTYEADWYGYDFIYATQLPYRLTLPLKQEEAWHRYKEWVKSKPRNGQLMPIMGDTPRVDTDSIVWDSDKL